MRCHICNSDTDSVSFQAGEFSPCAECQNAIYECVQGYEPIEAEEGEIELLDEDEDTHVC